MKGISAATVIFVIVFLAVIGLFIGLAVASSRQAQKAAEQRQALELTAAKTNPELAKKMEEDDEAENKRQAQLSQDAMIASVASAALDTAASQNTMNAQMGRQEGEREGREEGRREERMGMM